MSADTGAREPKPGENVSRESALALIAEANRWQAAYNKKCDELAAALAAGVGVPPDEASKALAQTIKVALDLGLQAWRSTPSRSRFHEAFDALQALLAGVGEARPAEDEERWCHDASEHEPHGWSESGRLFKCAGVGEARQPEGNALDEHGYAMAYIEAHPNGLDVDDAIRDARAAYAALLKDHADSQTKIEKLREHLDAARQALDQIANYEEPFPQDPADVYEDFQSVARAALGVVGAPPALRGGGGS